MCLCWTVWTSYPPCISLTTSNTRLHSTRRGTNVSLCGFEDSGLWRLDERARVLGADRHREAASCLNTSPALMRAASSEHELAGGADRYPTASTFTASGPRHSSPLRNFPTRWCYYFYTQFNLGEYQPGNLWSDPALPPGFPDPPWETGPGGGELGSRCGPFIL